MYLIKNIIFYYTAKNRLNIYKKNKLLIKNLFNNYNKN